MANGRRCGSRSLCIVRRTGSNPPLPPYFTLLPLRGERRPNLCPPRLHLAHRPFPPPTGCSIIVQEEMPVAPAIEEEIEEVAAAAEQVVTPWEVSAPGGIIDYDKLVDQFGCQRIDAAMVDRIELCYGTPE